MNIIDQLLFRMVDHNDGDPKRIQHLLKVHSLSRMIGLGEGLDEHTQFILEAAAAVHDIGIRPAEATLGYSTGKTQEELGPSAAKAMLEEVGVNAKDIERICYLVGHHHTYDQVDGIDYRILLEADLMVNLFEKNSPKEAVDEGFRSIFRTETGSKMFKTMFYGFNKED